MAATISTPMLDAFVRVAEHLSVCAAADELGVGKSVVSKRIAQLEAAVSATLFSRSTRRVALTPAGESYLVTARRALAELAGGQDQLRELRIELTGQIRLTAPISWGQGVLAHALPEFLHRHPAIEVELVLADRLMDVAQERIDIALRWSSKPAAELSALPLAEVAWVIAAAPGYLVRSGTPAEPEALAEHPGLCYWRDSHDDVWLLARGRQQRQVRVRSRYHANNPEAVLAAALAGLGVALIPGYLCTAALAAGQLVQVLPGWQPITKFGNLITAVAAPERLRIGRNQALLAYLREALKAKA